MLSAKCFHPNCPIPPTEPLETASGEILSLCPEHIQPYSDAEGFERLWKTAFSENTDQAFRALNDFYEEIWNDQRNPFISSPDNK